MPQFLRRFVAGALTVLLGLCAPLASAPAHAQSKEAEARALELAGQAKKAFADGRYQQAAMLFKQAYAQVPEPTLLFNAARAYQLGGYLPEALSVFRLYLTLETHDDPETRSGRAEAVEHVQAIEKAMAAKEGPARPNGGATAGGTTAGGTTAGGTTTGGSAAGGTTAGGTTAGGTTAGGTTAGGTTAGGATAGDTTAGGAGGGTVQPPPDALPLPARPVRRPGLFGRVHNDAWTQREVLSVSLLGAGAAICVGALVGHAILGGDLDDVEARMAAQRQSTADGRFYPGVTQREVDAAVQSHDDARFAANLTLGAGAVVAGVGAVLWLTRTTDDRLASRLQPTLELGPDRAMAGWSLRW
ncbi:MAG: hypothetical protein RIT45_2593 [Pseudomonadota bacterium]|jgi:hypothetical protein